jgi:hypothetical protein
MVALQQPYSRHTELFEVQGHTEPRDTTAHNNKITRCFFQGPKSFQFATMQERDDWLLGCGISETLQTGLKHAHLLKPGASAQ